MTVHDRGIPSLAASLDSRLQRLRSARRPALQSGKGNSGLAEQNGLMALQRLVGNRATTVMIAAQRSGGTSTSAPRSSSDPSSAAGSDGGREGPGRLDHVLRPLAVQRAPEPEAAKQLDQDYGRALPPAVFTKKNAPMMVHFG